MPRFSPQIVDPTGYDAVQDNLRFDVRGFYVRNAATNAGVYVRNLFAPNARNRDTVVGLFSLGSVNGGALPPGTTAAIVASFDFTVAGNPDPSLPAGEISATSRSGHGINGLFGAGTLAGLGFTQSSLADAVLITSSSGLNFAGASVSTLANFSRSCQVTHRITKSKHC